MKQALPAELTDTVRWHRLKHILADALEQPSSSERADTLRNLCGKDDILLREAERLLAQDTTILESFAQFASAHLREDEADRAGERVGAYAIIRLIGRGGMGAVYLGQRADGQFDRQVAIKILKRGTDTNDVLRRFRAERQILADLDHSYITRLFDAGSTSDGLPYFVMELVDGQPITDYLRQAQARLGQRVELFVQVCSAVEVAHEAGVIHRDIKPTNVLVKSDGTPKLLDFGIAKLLKGDDEENHTVMAERRLTPRYSAPEQKEGAPASVVTDIYALGTLLSELLPERNSSSALGKVIAKATNIDPRKRHSSAKALAADVTSLVSEKPRPRFAAGKQQKWALGALLLLAGGAILFLLSSRPGQLSSLRTYWSRRNTVPGPVTATNNIHAIAILPFQPLGQKDELLGLGMADAVISRMSGLRQLRVLPTAAVSKFNNREVDTLQAARSLEVDALVTGTVQRESNRVRVTVQLVSNSGNTLWSEKFDDTIVDIFSIQDSISQKVAESLLANLSRQDRERLEKHYTSNTAAYDSYLFGVSAYNSRTKEGLERAIKYFQEAVKSDPHYALVYAIMSDAYFLQSYYHYATSAEVMPKAEVAAKKALALDDSLAEAHLAISNLQPRDSPDSPGIKSILRAIEANPNYALAHLRYAWALCSHGSLERGVEEMRRAQALDPLSPTSNTALGMILFFARQYPESLYYSARAAELHENDPFIQGNLAQAYLFNGKYEEAIAHLRRAEQIDPTMHGDCLAAIAAVLISAGRGPEAETLMPEITALAQAKDVDPYSMAVLYATRGDTEAAFSWLAQSGSRAATSPGMLRYDPQLDRIRPDPRFDALSRKYFDSMSDSKK